MEFHVPLIEKSIFSSFLELLLSLNTVTHKSVAEKQQ